MRMCVGAYVHACVFDFLDIHACTQTFCDNIWNMIQPDVLLSPITF